MAVVFSIEIVAKEAKEKQVDDNVKQITKDSIKTIINDFVEYIKSPGTSSINPNTEEREQNLSSNAGQPKQ